MLLRCFILFVSTTFIVKTMCFRLANISFR